MDQMDGTFLSEENQGKQWIAMPPCKAFQFIKLDFFFVAADGAKRSTSGHSRVNLID